MTVPTVWHILTGEYPPDYGGVADYTAIIAKELAASSCEVHIWCPGEPAMQIAGSSIVHRLRGGFRPASLLALSRHLSRFAGPRHLLVQYVPHAFGMKSLNVPFCVWLWWRRVRHGDRVRVMFHEVSVPFVWRPLIWNLSAFVHRAMAFILLRAATQIDVSTPVWLRVLRGCGLGRRTATVVPIPSTIPYVDNPVAVDAVRKGILKGEGGAKIVGHFGTYGTLITELLTPILLGLLDAEPKVRVLLIGGGGEAFRQQFLVQYPQFASRITATGRLSAMEISISLQACDAMVQPYPDGASGRRTSLTATIANGVPTVSTTGPATEPYWQESGLIALVPIGDAVAFIDATRNAMHATHRESLRAFYRTQFDVSLAIRALQTPTSRGKTRSSVRGLRQP